MGLSIRRKRSPSLLHNLTTSITARYVDLVVQWFAVDHPAHVHRDLQADGLRACHRCHVRRDDQVRRIPERVARRERFVWEDIHYCAAYLLALQRTEQVARHEMLTPSDMDQFRTRFQQAESAGVENAAGFIGERQQAHENIGALQE